jgi:uncharacterized protein
MGTKIFVNLPVADLEKSKTFFKALGFAFNPQFSDGAAACMVISEENYAMLLTHAKFKQFTSRTIADTKKDVEVLVAVGLDSRDQVNKVADAALANGGAVARPPEDLGFMFTRAIDDPDGHTWELFYFDTAAMPKNS